MITSGCVRLSTMQQWRRQRRGIGWWQGCEARKLVSGAGTGVGAAATAWYVDDDGGAGDLIQVHAENEQAAHQKLL